MKYFIDCGTHFFEGLKKFNDLYGFDENWKIFSFEANPYTYEESKQYMPNINSELIHENKAVWINQDGIYLNINKNGKFDEATNLLENPPDKDIVYTGVFDWNKKEVLVETINFSNFIKQLKNKDPECLIVVKMDIEASEFDVLEKMIIENTFNLVDQYFIEFHERFFIKELEKYKNIKENIIKYANKNNVKLFEWF